MSLTKPLNRLELVDFLRGVAILEMLAAHFSGYFSPVVQRLVGYTETAMALFILLAGFMVGWHYPRFVRDRRQQTVSLWRRALQILVVQYVVICTVSMPLHLIGMPGFGPDESSLEFFFRSAALLNQIGLIHILPTFIPMFLVAPVILFAIHKRLEVLVLVASASVFCFGHFHPHALDLGQPTIFPFILFQLYFVVGILLGRIGEMKGTIVPVHSIRFLVISLGLLTVTMILVHGKVLPAGSMSIHPINLVGLMYHVPLILTVYALSVAFWAPIQISRLFPYVTRFGRHPLLAFVIHLYLAKMLDMTNYFFPLPIWVNVGLILLSLVAMSAILYAYEITSKQEERPLWTRTLRVLFN